MGVVSNGKELKNVDTGEYIPLKDGRTLPIKFRIEERVLDGMPPKGLVAYYPFNGNINDESGNNILSTANSSFLISDRFDTNNNAYFMDGATSHFSIEERATNELNEGTISFWMKVEPGTIQYNLFSKENALRSQLGAPALGETLRTFYFIVNNEAKNTSYAPDSFDYGFTSWNLYSYTWTNTEKKIYLNGQLLLSTLGNFITPSSGELYFGRNATNSKEFLNGTLDEIRIYNRALTNEEIVFLLNN